MLTSDSSAALRVSTETGCRNAQAVQFTVITETSPEKAIPMRTGGASARDNRITRSLVLATYSVSADARQTGIRPALCIDLVAAGLAA